MANILQKGSKFFKEEDKVFVCGTDLDDFLAAGAVKELHQIVKDQKQMILDLQEKNHTLSTRLARLENILFPESS